MQFVTYKKYRTEEEAYALVDLLELNAISYEIEDISPAFDITFSGGTDLQDKVAIKLKSNDFINVDKLLEKSVAENIELIDKDHYLFDFSNIELFDVLENYNEWCKTDYVLAQKLLNDRGVDISEEKVQKFKNSKNTQLRKEEKGQIGWIIFGFICSLLGGLLGIFIGYYYSSFKRTIPTGERIYVFDINTRKLGLIMFLIGLFSFIIWIFALLYLMK